eukprot:10468899-Alexandrium_andersonii.AAC.1
MVSVACWRRSRRSSAMTVRESSREAEMERKACERCESWSSKVLTRTARGQNDAAFGSRAEWSGRGGFLSKVPSESSAESAGEGETVVEDVEAEVEVGEVPRGEFFFSLSLR